MSQHTFSGPDREEVLAQIKEAYGTRATLVKAVREPIPGKAWGKQVTITVEVPEADPRAAINLNRFGIAALLADADGGDARPTATDGPFTATPEFDQMMTELATGTSTGQNPEPSKLAGLGANPAPAPDENITDVGVYRISAGRPPQYAAAAGLSSAAAIALIGDSVPAVPVPTRNDGDLVVVVGSPEEAIAAAKLMGKGQKVDVRMSGAAHAKTGEQVTDRRTALTARAEAVNRGRSVLVALGFERGVDVAGLLAGISPDEVWVAVDARLKPEDTLAMVSRVSASAPVRGAVVTGAGQTSTPQTVNTLGIPVGFVDGEPATQPTL